MSSMSSYVLRRVLYTLMGISLFVLGLLALTTLALGDSYTDYPMPTDMPPFQPGQIIAVVTTRHDYNGHGVITATPLVQGVCETEQAAARLERATITGDGTVWQIVKVEQARHGDCAFTIADAQGGQTVIWPGFLLIFDSTPVMSSGPWLVGEVFGTVKFDKGVTRRTTRQTVYTSIEACETFKDWWDKPVSFDNVAGVHNVDFVAAGRYCELQFDTPLPSVPKPGSHIYVHLTTAYP